MKNFQNIITLSVSYFFMLLFFYAAVSKLMDFERFQVQLAQSPMFGNYSNGGVYLTIASELTVVFMLLLKRYRLTGLYAALGLMTAFTVYIYAILNYSDSIPCSCGGILENMDWNTHLLFNLLCVALAIVGVYSASALNKTKVAARIAGVMLLPSVLVFLIFYPHLNDNKGLFTRKMIHPFREHIQTLLLPADHYYFAGHHGDSVFLAHHQTPLLLSTIAPDFKTITTDTIRLNHYNYDFVSVTIDVWYPYFSVYDGKVPVIFEGQLPSLKAYNTGIDRLYFSRLYMLAPHRYIFKTMMVKTKESEIGILNTATKKYWINPDVLQTRSNGVFDTDGRTSIDREKKQMYYTNLYSSEITKTDFELQHIERKHTIDSLTPVELETKTLKNGQTKLLRAPPEINRFQCIADQKLYNVSKMRGRNESYRDFRKNDVIDVYDVSALKYLHSFYLKNEERSKIRGILSTKHYLYVLTGRKITRYTYR